MTEHGKYTPRHNGLGKLLKGPEIRSELVDRAEMVVALYRERVRKRTGENARSVRVHTEMGGKSGDRWTAVVTAYAPHAAAREFGNYRRRGKGFEGEHVLRDIGNEMRGQS
ncbi:hypothetical protein P9990_17575 [Prescottella equi]|uniref:hypothetical protein n=1 Tax=Rhodococcus hoagii TaxID=43767 RepID=UPI0025768D4C|nr:hypothetical protein [Prescottella equi]WJJ10382.1 hypothetical protein P9990_17575 [Prescottella equi]